MSIIDKLGITPIQRHYNKLLDIDLFSEHEIREIEKQRNEMLEALIKDILMTEDEGWCEVCQNHSHTISCAKRIAVEKATGKTLEEICKLNKS